MCKFLNFKWSDIQFQTEKLKVKSSDCQLQRQTNRNIDRGDYMLDSQKQKDRQTEKSFYGSQSYLVCACKLSFR